MSSPKPFPLPDAATLQAIADLSERRLSAEEFDAWVHAPMSDHEREEALSLIRWFCTRYPTPAARLAAARRAQRSWMVQSRKAR